MRFWSTLVKVSQAVSIQSCCTCGGAVASTLVRQVFKDTCSVSIRSIIPRTLTFPANMQSRANIGPPAKRNLNSDLGRDCLVAGLELRLNVRT